MALPKVVQYMKNVGQSAVYASVANIKEDMPTISAIADHGSNKEVYKAVYSGIKDYKGTISRATQAIKSSKIYEAGELYAKSAIEDIRTGKFYNTERLNKIEAQTSEALFGSFDDDFDMSFDDGDMSFDDDDISTGDKVVAAHTHIASMKNAQMVSNTILKTSTAQLKATEASTSLLYTQQAKLFGDLRSDVINIGTRHAEEQNKSNKFLENIATNSQKFFEATTKSLNEQNAMLKEMLEMQRNIYGEQRNNQNNKKKEKISISDIISTDGVIDLQSWGKSIGRNVKSVVSDKSGGVFDMLNSLGGDDANMLNMFVANPFGMAMQAAIRAMSPKNVTKALKDFDKTLSGVGGTLIARLNRMASNEDGSPFSKLIGSIFGVKSSVKSSIDPGKFEKGPVPFDGITRATINNAIPMYLARIEAALTGEPARIYNPMTGRWTTARGVKEEFENMRKSSISSSTSDLAAEIVRQTINSKHYKYGSLEERKQMQEDINNFLARLYENGGDFKLKSYSDYYEWGVRNEDNFKQIAKAVREANRHARLGTAQNVLEGRESLNRRLEELEGKGSIYEALFANAFDKAEFDKKLSTQDQRKSGMAGALSNYKDAKGHDIFYYLQEMYTELYRIRNSFGIPGVGGPANIPFGTGKQFRSLTSPIAGHKLITDKDRDRTNRQNAEIRYDEELQAFVEKGGRVYSIYDGDAIKNIIGSISQEDRIKAERDLQNSGNFFQKALYTEHFTQADINKAREKKGIDELKGKFLDRFKEATLAEKFQMAINALNKATSKPVEWATDMIRKADSRIYEMLYGKETGEEDEEGNDIRGMMGLMVNRFNLTMNKMAQFANDKIFDPLKKKLGVESIDDLLEKTGIKDLFTNISNSLFGEKDSEGKRSGGLIGGFFKNVGESLSDKKNKAFDWIRESFNDVMAPIRDRFKRTVTGSKSEQELEIGSSGVSSSVAENLLKPITASADLNRVYNSDIANFNKELIKMITVVIAAFDKFPTIQREFQYGKNKFLFDPTNLSRINPDNAAAFLTKLIKYLKSIQSADANMYDIDSQEKLDIAYFSSERVISAFIKNNVKSAVDKAFLEKELESRRNNLTLAQRLKRNQAQSAFKNDQQTLRDLNEAEILRKRSVIDSHTRNGKAIRKFIDEQIERFKLDGVLAQNATSVLYKIYDANGKNLEEVKKITASKLYSAAIENGYTDLAIAIDHTMFEDYNNSDFVLSDTAVKALSTANKPGNNVFSKATELLQKIYDTISKVIHRDSVVVSDISTVPTDRNIVVPNIFDRRSSNRESETEAAQSGEELPSANAYGAYFNKAGTSALSEGEIYGKNGLYGKVPKTGVYNVAKGTTVYPTKKNKFIEIANEQNAISKFIKSNAEAKQGDTKVVDGNVYTYSQKDNGEWAWIRADKTTGKIYELVESAGLAQEMANTVRAGWNATKDRVSNGASNLKIGDNMSVKEIAGELKKAAPEMTASGAIGAAVGLLAGNPLLGAAVGASMGFVGSSEKAKTWLFGKEIKDADDNTIGREGGVVPKSVQDAFYKYAPNMAKHGLVGGALGLFTPFGLVGGALLGAAAGYIKSNDTARIALFGDGNDADSGIISKNMREAVKKKLPNIALGALGGALTGPFGLVGNLVLGSGIGMFSTTEEFKSMMLGEEITLADGTTTRVGGLLGRLREEVVDPFTNWTKGFIADTTDFLKDKVLQPLADNIPAITHEIVHMGKSVISFFPKMIDNIFQERFGRPLYDIMLDITQPARFVMGKAASALGLVAKGTVLAPVTAVKALGGAAKRAQIRRGDASYAMSAAERIAYRESHKGFDNGKDIFADIDRKMADLNSDEIGKALELARNLNNSKDFFRKNLKGKVRQINQIVSTYFPKKTANKIFNLCKKNLFSQAADLITTAQPKDPLAFTTNERKALIEKLQSCMTDVEALNRKSNLVGKAREDTFAELEAMGFKGLTDKSLGNFISSLQKEQKVAVTDSSRVVSEEEKLTDKQIENDNKNTQTLASKLDQLNTTMNMLINMQAKDLPDSKAKRLMTNAFDKHIKSLEEQAKQEETEAERQAESDKAKAMETAAEAHDSAKDKEQKEKDKNKEKAKNTGKKIADKVKATAKTEADRDRANILHEVAESGFVINSGDTDKTALQRLSDSGYKMRTYDDEEETKLFYDSDSNSVREFIKSKFGGWRERAGKAKTDADKREDSESTEKVSRLAKIFNALRFKDSVDEETGEEKKGLWSRIKGILGKGAKVLGAAGLGITAYAAAGHAGMYAQNTLVPNLTTFWETKAAPWLDEKLGGRLEAIKTEVKEFFIGLPEKIMDGVGKAATWVNEHKDEILTWYLDGIKASSAMITSVVAWGVSKLPTVLGAVVKNLIWPALKGVWRGLKDIFDGSNEVKDLGADTSVADGTVDGSIFSKTIADGEAAAKDLGWGDVTTVTPGVNTELNSIFGVSPEIQAKIENKNALTAEFESAKTEADKVKALKEAKLNAVTQRVTLSDGRVVNYVDSDLMIKDSSGNTMITNEQGDVVNSYDNERTTFSDRGKGGLLRRVITGNNGIIGKAAGAVGKLTKRLGWLVPTIPGKIAAVGSGMAIEGGANIFNKLPSVQKLLGDKNVGQVVGALSDKLIDSKFVEKNPALMGAVNNLRNSNFVQQGLDAAANKATAGSKPGVMKSLFNVVRHPIQSAKGAVKNVGSALLHPIKTAKNVAGNVVSGVKTTAGNIVNTAKNIGAGAKSWWESAKITGNAVKDFVAHPVQSISGLKDKIFSKGKSIVDGVTEVFDGTKKLMQERGAKEVTEEVAEKAVKEATEAGSKGLVSSIMNTLKKFIPDAITKLMDNFVIVGYFRESLKAYGKKASKQAAKEVAQAAAKGLISRLLSVLGESVAKMATKALAKVSATIASGGILGAVFAVADFVSGYMNANTILGVVNDVYQVGFFEKIIAGLLKCANGLLTLGIIPEETLVDVFIEVIAPLFKIDTAELNEARERSEQIVAEYNATSGTDYNIESYNNKDKLSTRIKAEGKKIGEKAWNAITGAFSSAWNSITGNDEPETITSTTTSTTGTGKYGRGRIYQRDPRISGMPFNRSGDRYTQTIGDSGCGPAAAVNAVNYAYGTSNNIFSAAGMAKNYKELNGGTRPEFFDRYFRDNGLNPTRLSGSSEIEQNLRSGNPIVLMGKDSKGGRNTPYGPNPHYITAKGIDRKGRIIVDDPENPYGTAVYNKNKVLGKTSLAISTGRYGRSKYGMAPMDVNGNATPIITSPTDITGNKKLIWSFLINKGYSEIAAAGIMGNIGQECGYNYAASQNNADPFKDGVGVGICQWTYKTRKQAFLNAVPDWQTNLIGQLVFMWNEINSTYKKCTPENLNKAKNIKEAVKIFHDVYEQSADTTMNNRNKYGIEAYNELSGMAPIALPDATIGTSTGSTSSGSQSQNIFSMISSAFTSIFDVTDPTTGQKSNLLSLLGIGGGSSSGFSTASSFSSTSANLGPAPTGLSDAQSKVYQAMASIMGKNDYDQDRRHKVGATLNGESIGYGDCSSTVQWALKTGAGVDPGGYTGAQIESTNGTWVDGPYEFGTKTMPVKDRLAVGDLMFYGKAYSNNPRKVTHVEMYYGDGKRVGHGSGIGPKVSNYDAMTNSQHYLGAKRFIPVGSGATAGMGSGNLYKYGMGAPVLSNNILTERDIIEGNIKGDPPVYGTGTQIPKYGRANSIDYTSILRTIMEILMTIADNSGKIDRIIELMAQKGSISKEEMAAMRASSTAKASSMRDKVNRAFGASNSEELGGILAGRDTTSIVQAMSKIAAE